jgi:hypothetical protein
MNLYLQPILTVVNLEPRSGSEKQLRGEEGAVVMEECFPVTCEGNAEWGGFHFCSFSFNYT